jgi:lysozyme
MSAIDIASAFVAGHEGCRLTAYRDSVGVLTAGYGHTGPDVTEGLVWTQGQADNALAADLRRVETEVLGLKRRLLTDQQMAALISFAFNLGSHALAGSTLLTKVNDADFIGAAHEFPKWDFAAGHELKGLLIRRFEEAALFLKGS